MKILLFGGSGQLGVEIQRRAADLHFEVTSPVSKEVNITDAKQVLYLARLSRADLVINCAAYTAVDKAEEEVAKAFYINRDGAGYVAEAAKAIGARLIHISTDYVFDGQATAPYTESAQCQPLNVYGKSKYAGEEVVQQVLGERALVVRTSWLHGKQGPNFVHTMLKLFREREVFKVVDDQWGAPTWTGWLAETLLDLGRTDCSGVIHATCSGVTTWFDYAELILELAEVSNRKVLQIERQKLVDSERQAKRPRYSVLDCSRLTKLLKRSPLPWQAGLRAHLAELGVLNQRVLANEK